MSYLSNLLRNYGIETADIEHLCLFVVCLLFVCCLFVVCLFVCLLAVLSSVRE